MYRLIFAFFLIIFIFSSCTKHSEESLLLDAKNKMDEANKLDSANKTDEAKLTYQDAVKLYNKVLEDYPSSTNAPTIYSIIAQIYNVNIKDYQSAIRFYKELADKYPNTKEAKYGIFMIAIIYDDNLMDKEMAKQSYRKFLEKYPKDEDPNDNMSASARAILQMLEQNIPIDSVIKNSQSTSKDSSTVKTKDKNQDKQDKTKNNKDKSTDKKETPPKNN